LDLVFSFLLLHKFLFLLLNTSSFEIKICVREIEIIKHKRKQKNERKFNLGFSLFFFLLFYFVFYYFFSDATLPYIIMIAFAAGDPCNKIQKQRKDAR